jgi:enoyl-CoA hydratase
MLLTGRFIDAVEAHALGMVTKLESADDLDKTVRDYAARIASHAPLTLYATKEMIRRILADRRLGEGKDRDLIAMCYNSADFREGINAFLSKRSPKWSGN